MGGIMRKPPSRRKKATSTASSNSEAPPDSANEDISQEDPASATITVSAVEVSELTEEEQRDKPDGMATLTACI